MLRDAPFGWWFLTGGLVIIVLPLVLSRIMPAQMRWTWESGAGLQIGVGALMVILSVIIGIRMRLLVSRVTNQG